MMSISPALGQGLATSSESNQIAGQVPLVDGNFAQDFPASVLLIGVAFDQAALVGPAPMVRVGGIGSLRGDDQLAPGDADLIGMIILHRIVSRHIGIANVPLARIERSPIEVVKPGDVVSRDIRGWLGDGGAGQQPDQSQGGRQDEATVRRCSAGRDK